MDLKKQKTEKEKKTKTSLSYKVAKQPSLVKGQPGGIFPERCEDIDIWSATDPDVFLILYQNIWHIVVVAVQECFSNKSRDSNLNRCY